MKKLTFGELKEMERQKRKDQILKSVIKILSKKPYYKLTLRDITRHAGISAASIYNYFLNMEEILDKIHGRIFTSFHEKLKFREIKNSDSPLESLAIHIVEFFTGNEEAFQLILFFLDRIYNDYSLGTELQSDFRAFMDNNIEVFDSFDSRGNTGDMVVAFYSSIVGLIASCKQQGLDKNGVKDRVLPSALVIAGNFSCNLGGR